LGTSTLHVPLRLQRERPSSERPRDFQKYRRWLRLYGEGIVAGTILLVIVLLVFFAQYITPHEATAGMNLQSRFIPPFWEAGGTLTHPLGTDNLGRDVLARTLYGGQVSLMVSFIASSLAVVIGVVYGLISGYLGGSVDRVLMRVTDIWVAFPFLVLALAVIAVLGSAPIILISLMALSGWVYSARITRAQTLQVRQMEYVQASIALGSPPLYIIRYHVVPHIIPANIVLWTLTFGTLIIVESSLSFIGLGVSPPTPSWGNMLSDSQMYLQDAWWMSVIPGAALMLTILCVNAVGDTLQKLTGHYMLH
jgi:peptide/nickel transport system permease protein